MSAVITAATAADLDDVRSLFREYEAAIGVDLCFQGFEAELASLPGAYAPPRGALFIARQNGEAIGCIGLRPFKNEIDRCEMKRLYVRPDQRQGGVGRQLVDRVLDAARAAGYRAIQLDTLQHMTAAQRLYRQLGFRDIPAYYANPLPGVVYLELNLEEPRHESCDHRSV